MSSVLAPIEPPAFREGHLDFYGAVELDAETGQEVWRFDSTTEMMVGDLFETANGIKYKGFRPSSVERLDDGLTLISEWKSAVWVDEDGEMVRREQHELFNEVHEVQPTGRGTYLVANTGRDTILELDEDWELVWKWNMWEHLDPATRPEGYYPHRIEGQDVREVAFAPDSRYHLNYVTELDEDLLLCSARKYGVFTVDRHTGAVESAFTNVDESHNPVAVEDGIVLCESGRDRVIMTDMDHTTAVLFQGGLSFVKDADPIDDDGNWLVTDSKNDRVLVWNRNEPEPRESFQLAEGAKPYEADYLEGSDSNA